jgi:diguanylate cyclase (GGDEF)-like protein
MKLGGIALSRLVMFIAAIIIVCPGTVVGQSFFDAGQSPRLNLINRSDGLPHNSVSSIQQDSRGFLWFGTQGGLARYDGIGFRVYKNVPFDESSLPHDLVQTVYYQNRNDTLWVGTYNGLARFFPGESGFTNYRYDSTDRTSLSDNVVITISEGPRGDIWAGTQNGLNRLRSDGTFQRYSIDGDVVRALFLDSRNDLWVGTYEGLLRWDPDTDSFHRVDFGWSSPFVMAITEVEPGTLLLGTWGDQSDEGGAVVVDLDRETFREHHFHDNRVYTVLAGSDGTLWAGTWGGGLNAVTEDGRTFDFGVDSPEGLASEVVYSLHEDHAGLVWVGTNGGGVHYLSPRRRNFRAFYHDPDNPDSLPGGKINVIHRDRQGVLWVGLYSGGLARYDEERDRWITYDHLRDDPYSLSNDIVTEIYEDTDGNLWIGTNDGLQMYDPRGDRFLRWGVHVQPGVEYSGSIVYQISEDSRGYFWIGTYRGGLTRVDRTTGETRIYVNDPDDPHSLSNNLIYDMLSDSNGDFWIATNGGLNRYRPETDDFQVFRYSIDNPDGLTSNTVRVLFEDSRKNFWIGTVSGGLNSFDRETGRFSYLTEMDGLSDNSILSILEGEDGRMWLGTQRGLTVYDPPSGLIDVFDERDGLFGSEFQSGHYRDHDGTLLFGGSHGITRIDSSSARHNTHIPSVQITDVKVFQESIAPDRQSFNGSHIELAPDEKFINFEFVGLDYESPESNQYAYQLVGFDRTRVDVGALNVATYTNLSPGQYEFRVWASNGDGMWATNPATMTVRLRPPWYRRWWAFVAYGLVSILLVLGALRWRTSRILEQKNRDLEYANARLGEANAELERLSIRDSLTGLFNRRYFDSRVQEEWLRARRSNQPLALLMIDVDHFKRFNDTYGHVVGDQVLSAAARIFEEVVARKTDFVARYGGGEFVVLLYDTSNLGAEAIAERIRQAVARVPLVAGAGEVTVSIGYCATVPTGDHEAEMLLRCADTALYRAKRNGRNRVEEGDLV